MNQHNRPQEPGPPKTADGRQTPPDLIALVRAGTKCQRERRDGRTPTVGHIVNVAPLLDYGDASSSSRSLSSTRLGAFDNRIAWPRLELTTSICPIEFADRERRPRQTRCATFS